MEMPLILGIDPGFSGALALIEPHVGLNGRSGGGLSQDFNLVAVIDMPLQRKSVLFKDKRDHIDPLAILEWITPFSHRIFMSVVESVHAAPGQGVVSMFRFGEGLGQIKGILSALEFYRPKDQPRFSSLWPAPSVWKACLGVSAVKETSLEKARQFVGPANAAKYISKKKDHGRAEAILLAAFGIPALVSRLQAETANPKGRGLHELT